MNTRRAFTLIELLVVVAIIVALLAILLPSMNRAIRSAEIAVEMSNYRQGAVAALSYASDNLAAMPRHPARTGKLSVLMFKRSGHSSLVDDLDRYVTNWEIWRCVGVPGVPPIDDPANTRNLSYCTVSYFLDRKQGSLFDMTEGTPSRLTEFASVSSFPMFQCSVRDVYYVGLWKVGHPMGEATLKASNATNPSGGGWQVDDATGVEGSSIAFADTHVTWFTMDELERVGPEAGPGTIDVWSVMP